MESQQYIRKYPKDKEDVRDIFTNLFPHKNKSIFMMAYKKEYEFVVNAYANEFLTDSEKILEWKTTNLMMFQCETCVLSNKFYSKRIDKNKEAFSYVASYSCENMNEIFFFDSNIFHDDFANKFGIFKKNVPEYLFIHGN